jgi:hypothetical protein
MAQRGFGRPGRPRSARQRPRRCRPASRRPTSGAQLAQARPVSRARKGPGRSLSRWHSRTPGQGSGCRRFRLSADRHGGAGRGQPSGTLGRRPVFLEKSARQILLEGFVPRAGIGRRIVWAGPWSVSSEARVPSGLPPLAPVPAERYGVAIPQSDRMQAAMGRRRLCPAGGWTRAQGPSGRTAASGRAAHPGQAA